MMIYLKCHTVSVLRSQANRRGAEAAGVFHPAANVRRSTLPPCVIQSAPRVIFAFIMIGGKKEVRSSLRVTRRIISPRGGDPSCFLPAVRGPSARSSRLRRLFSFARSRRASR